MYSVGNGPTHVLEIDKGRVVKMEEGGRVRVPGGSDQRVDNMILQWSSQGEEEVGLMREGEAVGFTLLDLSPTYLLTAQVIASSGNYVFNDCRIPFFSVFQSPLSRSTLFLSQCYMCHRRTYATALVFMKDSG